MTDGDGNEHPWEADQINDHTVTCQSLSIIPDATDKFAKLPMQYINTINKMRQEGKSSVGKNLGVIEIVVDVLAALDTSNNQCQAIDLNNHIQKLLLDPFDLSQTGVLSAEQACCACGGGSALHQPADLMTLNVLHDIYNSMGGKWWLGGDLIDRSVHFLVPDMARDIQYPKVDSGWGPNSTKHFCMWDMIRCGANAEIISISFQLANVTGTIPESIGSLTTLKFFISAPQVHILVPSIAPDNVPFAGPPLAQHAWHFWLDSRFFLKAALSSRSCILWCGNSGRCQLVRNTSCG